MKTQRLLQSGSIAVLLLLLALPTVLQAQFTYPVAGSRASVCSATVQQRFERGLTEALECEFPARIQDA